MSGSKGRPTKVSARLSKLGMLPKSRGSTRPSAIIKESTLGRARHDDIVAGVALADFGEHVVVGGEGVVKHLDPAERFKVGDGVLGNVGGPVVDAELLPLESLRGRSTRFLEPPRFPRVLASKVLKVASSLPPFTGCRYCGDWFKYVYTTLTRR